MVKNVIFAERYIIINQPIKEVLQIVKDDNKYKVVSATFILSNENIEQLIKETNAFNDNVNLINNDIELTIRENNPL